MVWAPDSRSLFVAGSDDRLRVVDAATARVHDLDVTLPPMNQVAIREA